MTDEEWTLVESHIPHAKRGGNKRTVNVVLNGLMYVLSTGCQWRASPYMSQLLAATGFGYLVSGSG